METGASTSATRLIRLTKACQGFYSAHIPTSGTGSWVSIPFRHGCRPGLVINNVVWPDRLDCWFLELCMCARPKTAEMECLKEKGSGTRQTVIPTPLEVEGREVEGHPPLCLKQPLCELLHHHLTGGLQLGWREQQAAQHRIDATWPAGRKEKRGKVRRRSVACGLRWRLLFSTFLDNPPGRKEGIMQRQRRMLGVSGVSRPQPGHHGLHGHMGKPECRSCKDVSDAGIHFGIVAPVRRHQTHHCVFSQDPWQVVVPC